MEPEQILTWLDEESGLPGGGARTSRALRVVVKLHRPLILEHLPPVCNQCDGDRYPCSTLEAIWEVLSGSET